MINVFIIDDHYLIHDGFNQLFNKEEDQIEVVGSALNINEALVRIPQLPVNIIILDLYIKFDDPVLNISCLKQTFPLLPVVILSQEESIDWQVKMFKEGASGYLFKEDKKQIISLTIQMVAGGQNVIPANIVPLLSQNNKDMAGSSITYEDKKLIHKMIEGSNIKEISKIFGKSISSIEKELKKIRLKFNAKTNFELLHYLIKNKII